MNCIPRSHSPDSLFSEPDSVHDEIVIASRTTPPIPGLWVFNGLLSAETANDAINALAENDVFNGGHRNQVMLFAAFPATSASSPLPTYILDLLENVRSTLKQGLPNEVYEATFNQELARQVILNLYPPGEGISPHIDLPNRYADGIIGLSLTGGCVMNFAHQKTRQSHGVYLPPRSVYIMTGEARWEWSHGIEGREEDLVQNDDGSVVTLLRDTRVSVTFRWMKRGGEVLS